MVRPKGGRGNLAPYETKLIRVPIPIEEQVQELISRYHHWMSFLDGVPTSTPYLLDKAVNDLKKRQDKELEQMRSQLEISSSLQKNSTELLFECHSDAFKAADILKAALKLPANAGGKIKTEIRKALKLIDDV